MIIGLKEIFAVLIIFNGAVLISSMNNCLCGKVRRSTRIVNGRAAEINEYPWMVSLQYKGSFGSKHSCGATLISSRYLITADHCQITTREIAVIGEHDLSTSTEAETIIRKLKRVYRHPRADGISNYDINVIEIYPIDFAHYRHIRPACLPTGDVFDNQKAVVTGWGTLNFLGEYASVLQEIEVKVLNHRKCEMLYEDVNLSMFCANGTNREGKLLDACQADSGGPLVARVKNSFELHGVVSWGKECARVDSPGVYANVYVALRWIRSVIGDTGCERNDVLPVNYIPRGPYFP